MNILKLFYLKNSMRKKILRIKRDMKKIIASICEEKFWIDWYGAYDINPKYLVFWICIETDEIKLKLQSDTILINKLRYLLTKHNYPEKARPFVSIGFESQETVNKESNGNWYQHFK
jgi:hypothetical protein